MVSDTIHRVRELLATDAFNKASMAVRAGLSINALRDADKDGWNPTAATLTALERHVINDEPLPAEKIAA